MKKIAVSILSFLFTVPLMAQSGVSIPGYFHREPSRGVMINRTHPISRGLVAYWLLNEGAGDKIYDLSGNGNVGTFTNMDPATDWVPGKDGHALDFDGDDDYVALPNISSYFNDKATFVIYLRIKTDPPLVGAQTGSWYLGTSGSGSHYPWTGAGVIYMDAFRDDRITGNEGLIADLTQWHQVAITNEPGAGNWKFWQNARVAFSAVGEASILLPAIPEIGQNSDGTYNLDGQVAFAGLWNRVLAASELEQLLIRPYQMFEQPLSFAFAPDALVPSGDGEINIIGSGSGSIFIGNDGSGEIRIQ